MACQLNLKVWDKKCFGHVRNSLNKKLKELQEAKEGGSYRTNPRRIYMLREEIQRLKNTGRMLMEAAVPKCLA